MSILILVSCSPDKRKEEIKKSLKVTHCSCTKRPIQFIGRFIAGRHPDLAYELFCSATVKNNSKETILGVDVTVEIQTKTGYKLSETDITSNGDNYRPGSLISLKSTYGTAYDLRYGKADCKVKEVYFKREEE
ncbi:hypothetical protein [Leptospira dzoumogneensis]|uniref:Uncharacterized protein n=1 Tax=Leptospira dzoumogneensis TaxID=2484904 RepID=A0A4Z1AQD8_9LEPT|nr:hypothetical protein [Leptospira dzoumogneensis]TGM97294.1 hypothetical protein EHR06_14175 [Leptospira dzoumogneensis]